MAQKNYPPPVIRSHKSTIIILGIFLIYLTVLPRLSTLATPCLQKMVPGPFEYNECNSNLIATNFLIFEILGAGIAIILYFIFIKKGNLKSLIVFLTVLAAAIITTFYTYLPRAVNQLETKAIYLDTFHEEYGIDYTK